MRLSKSIDITTAELSYKELFAPDTCQCGEPINQAVLDGGRCLACGRMVLTNNEEVEKV